MAQFTETQITDMMKFIKDYDGVDPDNITRELAILELEDIKRKGCTCESIGHECMGCSAREGGHKCPMDDWEKRHPEYKNDELAMKIKILEAGGEEAYKEKMKRQEEAKKKAEEEKSKATNDERCAAVSHVLNIYHKSKLSAEEAIHLIDEVMAASAKLQLKDVYTSLAKAI